MNIVFFGTSNFSAKILEALIDQGFNVTAIVTRIDKPQGRNLTLLPPPVKKLASLKYPNIPIYQPKKASTPEFEQTLKDLFPDIFVVVAYGEIIKNNILSIPPLGCINIHPSLLPKYRGAAPMHHALLNGDEETGVCIIEMSEAMDAGDILACEKTSIHDEDNFESLEGRLLEISKKLVAKVLLEKVSNNVHNQPHDHSKAILAPKINADIEKLNWNNEAKKNFNIIRALSPAPSAWCEIKIGDEVKRLKIIKARLAPQFSGLPGQIVAKTKHSLFVACKDISIEIIEVQPEGKKRMLVTQFLNGINKDLAFL